MSTQTRILRRPQVQQRTGLSRSSIYAELQQGSRWFDASFPRPVKLSARCVGWLEAEVEAWVQARQHQRDVAQAQSTLGRAAA
ncbi:helix-turn-helix transcriptional regulator [Chitiniphilus shinanonensis]|uniref:helix-turn-helix transcriptional regulator n=1 Tax=Chitiniphilus shinanonensis TaxID=553088 RepID=UPI00302800FB